jgi:hypothetical protein
MPRVSVLLPVFNAGETALEAASSILGQTFRDFELVLIDDGSVDGSVERVFSSEDPRLRLVTHTENLGIVAALNSGLSVATGDLIARIDADDIARPNRLQAQVDLMDARPGVGLCATGWTTVDLVDSRPVSQLTPVRHHGGLRLNLLYGNPIHHSTVMFRHALVEQVGGYLPERWPVEDYDLWLRLSEMALLAAIPQRLALVRSSRCGISARNTARQVAMAARLSYDHIEALLGRPPPHSLLQGWRASCAEIRAEQAVLLEVVAKVRAECRDRGIEAEGIREAAARVLVGRGYQLANSGHCRRAFLPMASRAPTIAVRAACLWLLSPGWYQRPEKW